MKSGLNIHWFFCLSLVASIQVYLPAAQAQTPEKLPIKTTIYEKDKYEVKQLVTPGFEHLPLKRKIFAYHLSLAIEAGRDIFWIQNNREGLALRTLLEKMWIYSESFDAQEKSAFEDYLFLVEANHGNYNETKNSKLLPENLTSEQFLAMAKKADLAAPDGDKFDFMGEAKRLEKVIFDPNYKPFYHANQAGLDKLADAATNFYGEGVKEADIAALTPAEQEHFLSYPERNEKGGISLTLQKIGGRFDEQLRVMDYHFAQAQEYANPEEKIIIESYRKVLRTGDPKDLEVAETLWVQYRPTDLDFVISFVEVYNDPLGFRGSWEGFILMLEQTPESVARTQAIRSNADYFEMMMPVNKSYKKAPGFTPPKAEGAYLVFSGGGNGERPFAGVNLPNNPHIHSKYGSKSFTALNVMHEVGAKGAGMSQEKLDLFYLPRYHALVRETDAYAASVVQVEFHEILGHGSGANLPGANESALKEYFNPLEETRAETASLYHALDPKVREFGIVPQSWTDHQLTQFFEYMIVDFFTRQIRSYLRLSDTSDKIRQAHQWGRQVMLNRLTHEGALEIIGNNQGSPQVKIISLEKVRDSLGRLWSEIQDARSTGSYEKAAYIMETWGVYTDTHRKWRTSMKTALSLIEHPIKEPMYLNPSFDLKKNELSEIIDVQLLYNSGEKGLETVFKKQIARTEQYAEMKRKVEKGTDCGKMLGE